MTAARARGGRTGERGSAAVWVVSCCALICVVAAVSVVRTTAVLARHRAEAGADLAALAAAEWIGRAPTRACPAAAEVARRNGARLRSCRLHQAVDGRSGWVSVSVMLHARLPVVGPRTVVASARAARLPASPGPPTASHAVACWLPSSERAPPARRAADEGTE